MNSWMVNLKNTNENKEIILDKLIISAVSKGQVRRFIIMRKLLTKDEEIMSINKLDKGV